jgi:alkanesulfonate monooxygenase SsuD/methylene tetrahydromethanopterin reductase-like flavin-dependent oxidoreductase (luciferase family)
MNPVQFGVFVSPQHTDLQRLHERVHTADVAGFDYAAIPDHPYAPAVLDTFALIGVLLGRTSRLRFVPNVANLPLRPPAMLAKTSAALDLLSGGRFELGLGGGRLWPQIAGLGGPRLTPRRGGRRHRRGHHPAARFVDARAHREVPRPALLARQRRARARTGATTSESGSVPWDPAC